MRRHVWDVEALGLTPRYPTHCEGAWALFDIQTSRLLGLAPQNFWKSDLWCKRDFSTKTSALASSIPGRNEETTNPLVYAQEGRKLTSPEKGEGCDVVLSRRQRGCGAVSSPSRTG